MVQEGPSQIPSFVTTLPSGNETGLVLAVDLGGTNCRVCSIELHGDSKYTVRKSQQAVPRNIRVNPSYKPLFRSIATQLKQFLETQHAKELQQRYYDGYSDAASKRKIWKLGFVFSFTYVQTSLTEGKMVHWDKDWDIPEAIDRNPCEMLQAATDELGLPVVVVALANDSVGTLMTRAYTAANIDKKFIGAIFGTGTNAAYVERLERIEKVEHRKTSGDKRSSDFMIVNTEWGNFDNEMKVLPQTSFDVLLDTESTHPGDQALEKRIAGLYLAELLRLVLRTLWNEGLLAMTLREDSPILHREGLDSAFLSEMENTPRNRLREFLSLHLRATDMSDLEALAIQTLGAAIVRRSARLAGIALGATIFMSTRNPTSVVDSKVQPLYVGKEGARSRAQSGVDEFTAFPKRVFEFFWRFLGLKGKSRRFISFGSCRSRSIIFPKSKSKSGTDREEIVDVGVDGSLIRYYPSYERLIRETLRDLASIGPATEARIEISFVEDGSAVGAALVALSSSILATGAGTDNIPKSYDTVTSSKRSRGSSKAI